MAARGIVQHRDLTRLQEGEWFNDDVINFGMVLWFERFLASAERTLRLLVFSTFFFKTYKEKGHKSVCKWTKHRSPFESDCIIIPANNDLHWFAIILWNPAFFRSSPSAKWIILTLCSLRWDQTKARTHALSWLTEEHCARKIPGSIGPVISLDLPCASQKNGFDCGAYMIHNIQRFIRNHQVIIADIQEGGDSEPTSIVYSDEVWQKHMAVQMRGKLRVQAQRCPNRGYLRQNS
ncbi:hypothetical protein M422DRAFT_269247 [Sphaerobolus stellatus SS14]|uniref:Ubiquitin-like protease family profile domain-containing protein n=1 Tax=Sphaerobolus stellatus (strain SS14) TaxID=990650 RepID=A0A0C9TIP7_SPHS4|nr:hypothetical protein M422DRAFT_269247 [Sphaerobolus stellatus SS14]